jgi:hypothetical protein
MFLKERSDFIAVDEIYTYEKSHHSCRNTLYYLGFHVYKLSRQELQMNVAFQNMHNSISDLIIKHSNIIKTKHP